MFHHLQRSIETLRDYYSRLSVAPGVEVDGFPYICEYDGQEFSYVERLGGDKKEVYNVMEGNELQVVKFAKQYNSTAHELLAEERGGERFVPTLRHVSSSRYSGRIMIVVDYVDGKTASGEVLCLDQYLQVEKTIRQLYEKGLVFGDLRKPNILLSGSRVPLVDFDWCGKDGEGIYPIDLSPDAAQCPKGVGAGQVMEKEHDNEMLEKLFSGKEREGEDIVIY